MTLNGHILVFLHGKPSTNSPPLTNHGVISEANYSEHKCKDEGSGGFRKVTYANIHNSELLYFGK